MIRLMSRLSHMPSLLNSLAGRTARATLLVTAAAAVAAIAPPFAAVAGGQNEGVFTGAGPASVRVASVVGDAPLRSRLVTINAATLEQVRSAVIQRAPTAPLVFNLFDDTTFNVIIDSQAPTFSGGYSISGRLADQPLSSVTLVVNGDIVAGSVRTLEGTYSIESADDGLYAINDLDPASQDFECEVLEPPSAVHGEEPPLHSH